MKTGTELIADERQRQVSVERWSAEHDDQHSSEEMLEAALCYAQVSCKDDTTPRRWPWNKDWWRPSDDPIRNLTKAGALIAAEIDRIQRLDLRRREFTERRLVDDGFPAESKRIWRPDFDRLARDGKFVKGPFVSTFGDSPGDPYIPISQRKVWGQLPDGPVYANGE